MFSGIKSQLALFILVFFLSTPIMAMDDIPTPKQSAYTSQGLLLGLGLGVFQPSGSECNCIVTWQGHVDFFYLPFLSAGFNIRFFGGDIDDHSTILYQRYEIHSRVYKKLTDKLVLFGSPLIGFETTDLQAIQKNIIEGTVAEESLKEDACIESFSLNGFSLGLEAGAGLKIVEDWGFTSDFTYEYNFSSFHYISFSVGAAFNLRNHLDRLKKSMFSTWLSFEVQSQRYFGGSDAFWSQAYFLGISFGI